MWYLWECKVSDQQLFWQLYLRCHYICWGFAVANRHTASFASFSWVHLAWRHHDYSAIRGFLFWTAWNRQARFESGEHEFESVSLPSAPGEVTSINKIFIWIGTDRSSYEFIKLRWSRQHRCWTKVYIWSTNIVHLVSKGCTLDFFNGCTIDLEMWCIWFTNVVKLICNRRFSIGMNKSELCEAEGFHDLWHNRQSPLEGDLSVAHKGTMECQGENHLQSLSRLQRLI